MTILPWPKPNRAKTSRNLRVDPLPQSVLHQLVSDLPGPKGETPTERAARFDAQLAEVLSYNPRDSAEAMLATHCVLLRLLTANAHRDASRPNPHPVKATPFPRIAKQMDKLVTDMQRMLESRQARPLGKMDPAIFASLGLEQFLIAEPDDTEEAFSAVIVPLHPAPKMLQ